MENYRFIALCIIEQQGDDNDPSTTRNVVQSEVIAPPTRNLAAVDRAFAAYVAFHVALERFRTYVRS